MLPSVLGANDGTASSVGLAFLTADTGGTGGGDDRPTASDAAATGVDGLDLAAGVDDDDDGGGTGVNDGAATLLPTSVVGIALTDRACRPGGGVGASTVSAGGSSDADAERWCAGGGFPDGGTGMWPACFRWAGGGCAGGGPRGAPWRAGGAVAVPLPERLTGLVGRDDATWPWWCTQYRGKWSHTRTRGGGH